MAQTPPEYALFHPATQEPGHPLTRLQGAPLGTRRLSVWLGPANRVGARYFQLRWAGDGRLLLAGLHHSGLYPGHNWIEVISTDLAEGDSRSEEALFRLLVGAIAPGGHVMVEYESPSRHDTERALVAGVPPVLTPLGAMLLRAGFGAGFRDWYISEGWSEGPRKLQAYRPLDTAHQREKARAMLSEAKAYLASPAGASVPRTRARRVLTLLRRLAR